MPVQSQTFTTSGTWTVPAGINYVKVECWGAGGSGGTTSRSNGRGGGGSGGNYARGNIVYVSPGSTYIVNVGVPNGNRDSSFGYNGNKAGYTFFVALIRATGGVNGASTMTQNDPANAAGGVSTTAGCIGDIIYQGGNGGTGSQGGGSGAGGGGAGSNANGSNASGSSGGAGGSGNGGSGANGVQPASAGNQGASYGGGGSGGANSTIQFTTRYGGLGGWGLVVLTWGEPDPTYLCVYSNCNPINAGGSCYLYEDQALTTVARGGRYSDNTNCYTVNSSGLVTSVSACCAAYGTFINAFCSGGALYYNYADGSCGTYSQLISSCDAGCGCDGGCTGRGCI